ncbi:hypothetical protein L0P88_03975 [Muricauda sp. SCSIO 64092]|uniref:DUF6712 family protein n=1 Tax=Allomuricauda sp. SCSIO 64092 TaxID=2908842 RepID=UPI001FF6AEB2|nr:DUF6712 family protein [Muricauda sp. SCSIO 64092]UOY07712.1 hypothetical protein L0P88_03975 [Muricauda sp. SCSIO 64092]
MDLLFNHGNNGQDEIKATLGFLSADFTYKNLEPDIYLWTPDLIEVIGQSVYDRIVAFYNQGDNPSQTGVELATNQTILKFAQLYVLSMAYLAYAPDNDLIHGNDGRTMRSEEDQEKPYEWQINKSNSNIKKRAYKALDQLLLQLDAAGWSEWTESEQYTMAKSLYLKNTNQFDAVFVINKSGQLYYRLVPFMGDIEYDEVMPILGQEKFLDLRSKSNPTEEEKTLILLVKKAVAYKSLGKALKAFPVEMFPEGMVHTENTRMKSEARAEVMQFMNKEGSDYLIKLEYEFTKQSQTYEDIPLTNGLNEGSKFVDL